MATISASPQTEALLAALHTLYSNSDRAAKERANSFLETFQKSVLRISHLDHRVNAIKAESWPIVLSLLEQGSTAGDDVKVFAAQTLRSKARPTIQ